MDLSDYEILEPPKHLMPYVRRYFYINRPLDMPLDFELYQSNSAYFVNFFSNQHRSVKKEQQMIVSIDDVQARVETRWTLGGPILNSSVSVSAPYEMRMLVCEFNATAIYQLFGIEAVDLTDKRLELTKMSEAVQAIAKTCFLKGETASMMDHVEEMNAFLTRLSEKARDVDPNILKGIALLEACDGVIKISDLVEELKISERQFLRNFTRVVGMRPKKYGQVLQINWALKLMFLEGDNAILSEIAQEAGFSDQSHFIKVMKSIFKQSPIQFLESGHIEIEAFLRQDSHFEAIMALMPKKDKSKKDD